MVPSHLQSTYGAVGVNSPFFIPRVSPLAGGEARPDSDIEVKTGEVWSRAVADSGWPTDATTRV